MIKGRFGYDQDFRAGCFVTVVQGRGWTARADGANAVIVLSGDWTARAHGVEADASDRISATGAKALAFDATALGRWDSALIAFVSSLCAKGIAVDDGGLPPAARRLLALATEPVFAPQAVPPRPRLLARVGVATLRLCGQVTEISALIGATCLKSGTALAGRSVMRSGDLWGHMRDAGFAALPIVTVINVLVGGILAFVGAVQLRRFGADIYVASLVGIAMVREMAALMTAIIMSGRTGGAYAATLATMQGNEEIDALQVLGVPVFDYLVLPRILALTGMMPILYLYGCAVGMVGGFAVAVMTLDLSPAAFIAETRAAVTGSQFALGLSKSVVFGALIAVAGCRAGLRAGRSAADVGKAATAAVVASVVGVIAVDAIFALCANALGI